MDRRQRQAARRCNEILRGAEAEGRSTLTAKEKKEFDREFRELDRDSWIVGPDADFSEHGIERHDGGDIMSNDKNTPSFGGEGRLFGYSARTGQEVRAFKQGDSIFRYKREKHGYSELWDHPDAVGKYLRARAVGPRDDWEARAVSSTAGGGNLVPQPIQDRVLDDLKAQSVLFASGASLVEMESDTLSIARVSGAAGHSWLAEGTTGASTDPTFSSVTLDAETLRGIHRANRELVMDSPDFPAALQRELTASLSDEFQRVALGSTGRTNEPTGLLASTVINSAFFGSSDGSAVASTRAYGPILEAVQRLQEDNVPERGISALWGPRTARQFAALTDTQNQPLQRPQAVAAIPFRVTSSIGSSYDYGSTSITNGSHIFVGDFSDLVVGMRMDPNIEVLRERYAENFQLGWLSFLRADLVMRRPQSMERIEGITT